MGGGGVERGVEGGGNVWGEGVLMGYREVKGYVYC